MCHFPTIYRYFSIVFFFFVEPGIPGVILNLCYYCGFCLNISLLHPRMMELAFFIASVREKKTKVEFINATPGPCGLQEYFTMERITGSRKISCISGIAFNTGFRMVRWCKEKFYKEPTDFSGCGSYSGCFFLC